MIYRGKIKTEASLQPNTQTQTDRHRKECLPSPPPQQLFSLCWLSFQIRLQGFPSQVLVRGSQCKGRQAQTKAQMEWACGQVMWTLLDKADKHRLLQHRWAHIRNQVKISNHSRLFKIPHFPNKQKTLPPQKNVLSCMLCKQIFLNLFHAC